jgi:hypothetical protein
MLSDMTGPSSEDIENANLHHEKHTFMVQLPSQSTSLSCFAYCVSEKESEKNQEGETARIVSQVSGNVDKLKAFDISSNPMIDNECLETLLSIDTVMSANAQRRR